MSISDKRVTNYAALSIPFGALVAILSVYLPVTLPRVLNVLAIIQATFLSIIIAIYILGSQVLLERYSSRVLELDPNEIFTRVVVLFGGSIFFDLLLLLYLDYIITSEELIFYAIWVTFTLGFGAFYSLIMVKNEIVGSTQPESVADLIIDSVTEDRFWEQTGDKDNSHPFHNEFEITRNSLRSDDRQDSRNILEALTSSLTEVSDSVFPVSDTQAVSAFFGFSYIVNELRTIADLTVERDDKEQIDTTIDILCNISIDSVESGFDRIGASAVGVIREISEQIIPSRVPETLAKSTWLSYSKILGPASEEDAMRTIAVTTSAISALVADIEEESDLFGSPSDKIAEILIQALLDGWEVYLENHGDSVPVSEIGYADPKYFTGDLLEYEHSFNHFEDNFQRCSKSISRIFSADLGEARVMGIDEAILGGLKDLAVTCADIDNEGLAYHFSMLIVFIGVGLNYGSSDISGLLEEISSTNAVGSAAVDHMFVELGKFPKHNGPLPHVYLGTTGHDFHDDTDAFQNQLMEIELEIYH